MRPPYYIAIVLYCVGIFTLSHMPAPPTPEVGFPHLDKIAHFILFGGLSGLISVGLHRSGQPHPRHVLLFGPVLAAAAYGAFDEIHQYFIPPRTTSLADLLADISGAAVAQSACLTWFRARPLIAAPQPDET